MQLVKTSNTQSPPSSSSGAKVESASDPRHIGAMAEPQLQSTLTCPHCGHQTIETMPTDACVAFYDCKGCGATLKPLPGSCCVFCSYGSVPCPPMQEGVEPCCTPKPDRRPKDWVGSLRKICWVVAPHRSHRCWPICADPVTDNHLDRSSRVDGHSLHLKCPAVWPHSIALYRAILLGHDCSGFNRRIGHRSAWPLWLGRAWAASFLAAAMSSGGPRNVCGANSPAPTFINASVQAGFNLRTSD